MANTFLVSPTSIDAFKTGAKSIRVVIETPKGCRNKYKYDEELGAFTLSSVLPEGMAFPYDFGFVPGTRAEDGDPMDVLVLMDVPAFAGAVVEVRIVGIIEGRQRERKEEKAVRNDRLIAVSVKSHEHSDIETPGDLNPNMLSELEHFFVAYHRERGTKYELLGIKGPKAAIKHLKETRKK